MLTFLSLFLFAQDDSDFKYAEVISETAAIHAFYDAKSAVVYEAVKGMPLKVVAEVYPWSKVQIPGGFDLWVYKELAKLDAENGVFRVIGSRTRARPLPSTASSSHPLGLFPREFDLVPLAENEEWVQVRAPEELSAWILTSAIKVAEEDMGEVWKEYSENRQAVSIFPPEAKEEILEEPVSGQEEVVEAIVAQPVEIVNYLALAQGFDESRIALNPKEYLDVAIPALEVLGDNVARDVHTYDFDAIARFETQFAYVIWHSSDSKLIKEARSGLTVIDGMRNFYISRIDNLIINTDLAEEGNLDPTMRSLRDRAMYSRDTTAGELDILVGWVEFAPRPMNQYPFSLVRSKMNYLVYSPDSHVKLKPFNSRAVIMRGKWGETIGTDSKPLFHISEIRVLPPLES
jgi:SH3-like domain-containing protein